MKFLDLFAGIGGFRLGMEQAGHECVGFVEWDKYARKSYEAIHDTEGEWTAHDITTVTDGDLEFLSGQRIDIICGGFPCQSFSVAGKRGGFSDTRGTMFFEIARFVKQIKPRFILLENVKGLLSHDQGNTFGTILHTLDELGYDCEWQVLNSKNFGVPQNRERVFIVGHLRGSSRREVFPISATDRATNLPIEIVAHHKNFRRNLQTFSPNGITETLDSAQGGGRGHYTIVKPVLTPDRPEIRQKGRRFKAVDEPMLTRTTQDRHGVMINDKYPKIAEQRADEGLRYFKGNICGTLRTTSECGDKRVIENPFRIRKLTPLECWRLQSFPDWAFDKASEVNSDSQLYKQAGNSVTVSVIYEIAIRLSL